MITRINTSIGIATLLILMLVCSSTRSYALRLTAKPDTVLCTDMFDYFSIAVSDGRDSSQQPHTPLTYAHAWITGDTDFLFASDSLLSFFGTAHLYVQFRATSSQPGVAILHIAGDSNTVTVVLVGDPPNHRRLYLTGPQDFDNLHDGIQTCDTMSLYNPNGFAVSIDRIWMETKGTYSTLSNVPATPFTLAANASVQFQACITGALIPDTSLLGGTIHASYSFTNGNDTASLPIYGYTVGPDTAATCISIPEAYFGSPTPGDSVWNPFEVDNKTGSVVIVDSMITVGGDSSEIWIDRSKLPITVQPHTYGLFGAIFKVPFVPDKDFYQIQVETYSHIQGDSIHSCSPALALVDGKVGVPLVDSVTLLAPPGGDTTFTISTKYARSDHSIFIQNDGKTHITLSSLQLTDTTQHAYFETRYQYFLPLYDTLPPGWHSRQQIFLTLDVADTGTYPIDLALAYYSSQADRKREITTQPTDHYRVIVHRVPAITSSVKALPIAPSVDFTISPNPARGEVTIAPPEGTPSTIEIYNVLGSLILRKQVSGPFVWNGETSMSERVPDGTYIVRVSEVHPDSYSSVSKRLMLLH